MIINLLSRSLRIRPRRTRSGHIESEPIESSRIGEHERSDAVLFDDTGLGRGDTGPKGALDAEPKGRVLVVPPDTGTPLT